MTNYQWNKAAARAAAIECQLDFNNHNYYWSELAAFAAYFEKIGRRYGLLTEFRQNGII